MMGSVTLVYLVQHGEDLWARTVRDRDWAPADGESSRQAEIRLEEFLSGLADTPGPVAAVTHGGVPFTPAPPSASAPARRLRGADQAPGRTATMSHRSGYDRHDAARGGWQLASWSHSEPRWPHVSQLHQHDYHGAARYRLAAARHGLKGTLQPGWGAADSAGGLATVRTKRPSWSMASLASGRKLQKTWKSCVGTG